jgi:lysyl-tRNA synthetase class 2
MDRVLGWGNCAVTEAGESHEAARLAKLQAIEALGIDPWGGRFDGHMPVASVRALPVNPESPAAARIAGRVVLRRVMGNVHFLDVQDSSGRVQVMLGKKQVGELGWKLAQELDLGDLVGVDGTFGATKTGEPTVFAREVAMLAKSLLPHPDKHSGMTDMEFRLRHRYLDLTYNAETMDRARQRVMLVRAMRRHLDDQGFLEVETPTLHAVAGGAAARPFATHHNALDIPLVLRIALELPLKRLLVGGMEKVYEIGRVFRNEGISPRHNPEFTMLELYQAYSDYRGMMDLTEGLIHACATALRGSGKVTFGGAEIDFTPPFERATYAELLARHAGADMADPTSLERAASVRGIDPAGKHPDVLAQLLFEQEVEHRLKGPVFVHDYPASLCPLTRRKRGNPAVAERFELFVRGMELANAYSELNDPILQEATFRQQLAGLAEDDSMARMDDDFVRALRHGMPPAGGLGIGVDRLAMLLTDTTTIRDVILFPLLRPERGPQER